MNDKHAIAKIQELEEQLEEAYQLIDLLYEDVKDRDNLVRSLKGQLANLKIDRRYEVG